MPVTRGEVGGRIVGGRREGFSGTSIKDEQTKPRCGGSKRGRWEWLGWEGVLEGKWRQAYFNNNKKKENLDIGDDSSNQLSYLAWV